MRQIVIFEINTECYGIDINKINEILTYTEPSKIPDSLYFIDGVINLRGKIIAILNLRKRLSLPFLEINDATRILIVGYHSSEAGILVDSVSEVIKISDETRIYEKLPDKFACEIVKHNDKNIFILDIESLFNYSMAIV
jgi:purine-binding chemotaxis protein CheW